jgi:hypothetical protein
MDTQAAQPQPNQQPTPPKKRKWVRRIGIGLLVILAFGIFCFPKPKDPYDDSLCVGYELYSRTGTFNEKTGEMPIYSGTKLFGFELSRDVEMSKAFGSHNESPIFGEWTQSLLTEPVHLPCFGIVIP